MKKLNDDDNTRRAARTHVSGKYRMLLEDAQGILRREIDVDLPKEDTVLLKGSGLTLFNFLHQPPTNKFCNKNN